MITVMHFEFLGYVPIFFAYVALVAWIVTFTAFTFVTLRMAKENGRYRRSRTTIGRR